MPEVELVAILDADKEGFLRSERSLIQTIGRAARNVNGRAILYADRITGSMQRAIDETSRRRDLQISFNEKAGIVPKGIHKSVSDIMEGSRVVPGRRGKSKTRAVAEQQADYAYALSSEDLQTPQDVLKKISELEGIMHGHAKNLEFEQAAFMRDQITDLREKLIEVS